MFAAIGCVRRAIAVGVRTVANARPDGIRRSAFFPGTRCRVVASLTHATAGVDFRVVCTFRGLQAESPPPQPLTVSAVTGVGRTPILARTYAHRTSRARDQC